jgi:hypothetical protein
MIRRREFIAGLGSAAAWPLVARAQQAALPVVGFVYVGSADALPGLVAAFRKGLGETGYVSSSWVTRQTTSPTRNPVGRSRRPDRPACAWFRCQGTGEKKPRRNGASS